MSTAAILLAAGTSSRMGQPNKMLLSYKGQPMIRWVASQLINSNIDRVIIVLGHESEKVMQAIFGLELQMVINSKYKDGMTSSIQAGVSMLTKNENFLVCLGDQPKLHSQDYDRLLNKIPSSSNPFIIVPSYESKKGNPVCFSSYFQEEILGHAEPNGCKSIVKQHHKSIIEVDMPSDATLFDVDTKEQYQNLK